MHEYYNKLGEKEKEIFTMGRKSVLDDFDSMCYADAFVGFTTDEWKAIKKFFAFNKAITENK